MRVEEDERRDEGEEGESRQYVEEEVGGIERRIVRDDEEEEEGGRERVERSANRNARVASSKAAATDQYRMGVKRHQNSIRSAVECCSLLSIFDSFSSVPSTSFEEEEAPHSSLSYK